MVDTKDKRDDSRDIDDLSFSLRHSTPSRPLGSLELRRKKSMEWLKFGFGSTREEKEEAE